MTRYLGIAVFVAMAIFGLSYWLAIEATMWLLHNIFQPFI